MTDHADTIRALLDDVEHWRLERSGPSSIAEIQKARAEWTTLLAERQQLQEERDGTQLAYEGALGSIATMKESLQQAIDALRRCGEIAASVQNRYVGAELSDVVHATLVNLGEDQQ